MRKSTSVCVAVAVVSVLACSGKQNSTNTCNGSGERQSSPYVSQTSSEGVIMAFPTGKSGPMGNAWNVGPCCVADVDDVAFAKAMVEETKKVACIDPKRVYAVGFSMGGGMSHYLACRAADVFAAVAPAAFDLLEENVGGCKPSRPISVISFRGTNDNVSRRPYASSAAPCDPNARCAALGVAPEHDRLSVPPARTHGGGSALGRYSWQSQFW